MKVLSDRIFIIEDFLSEDTCNFLIKSFSNNLIKAPEWTLGSGDYSGGASKGFWKEGVFAGPSYGYKHRQVELSATNKIIPYNGDNDLSKDLLTGVGILQEKAVANIFKKDIHLDHMLYCHMIPGAKNELHWDNWLDIQTEDHSGLLYLTDDYEGGLLQFPDQGISLKPKRGTFICFKGDDDLPHEVTEVTSGNRINLITFYSIRS